MLYLIAAIAIFITFLFLIKGLSEPDPRWIKSAYKFTMIALGVFLVIMLFRFGQPIIGALLGVGMAVLPYFKHILKFLYGWKLLRKIVQEVRKASAKVSVNKGGMSVEEAREVLGVSDKATKAEIDAAYKRLIKANHPDKGGSKYLAEKLNEARRVLTHTNTRNTKS